MTYLRVLIVALAFAFSACAMEFIDVESSPDELETSCEDNASAAGAGIDNGPGAGAAEAPDLGGEQPTGCEGPEETEGALFTCPIGQQFCVDYCCPQSMLCCPDYNGFMTCMDRHLC